MGKVKSNNQPLSNLQRCILCMCHEEKYVHYNDVLHWYYGFEPSPKGMLYYGYCTDKQPLIHVARVGICKSFNRLVQRGLLRRVHEMGHWNCVALVDKRG